MVTSQTDSAAVPSVQVEGLTRTFGPVTALADLTVAMPQGVVGLVGANGAGKSTLIKILLGLLPATSGRAEVLGLDCATDGLEIRGLVGYMPESDCLPPDVSATELIVHLARMSGLPTAVARERTADTLRHVGLYEERYRPIGGYSTGMKQRVKLAQALVHDPRLVLLDEPTNGLDPAGRDEMLALIQRISTEFSIAVVVTSHLLGELERIADHVVVIESGVLQRSTSTADATGYSGVLLVEVTDRGPELAALLRAAGAQVVASGSADSFTVELADESVLDTLQAGAADLEVGLVRMQRRRHHLTEIFSDRTEGERARH
ncbi:ABC transporter ATP-binding protein [Actinotalea sp. K2]|uniref:ABC transporter ATP-binding protein n=1 Tax=Actinotalea sp. K2 TaxID=2939438 RepID=UPI0020179B8B|nr:ABC transporter ATP-binding protein [Actinotalea sp. K2]MCL3859621.1 ABC transporter ATP-binding protein [Actinotalea sp. K2]